MKKLPILKAKKKPTRSQAKQSGTYIGFDKLVEKLKRKKGISENSLEKALDILKVEDFFEELWVKSIDGVIMNTPEFMEEIGKAKVYNPAGLAAYIGRKKYGKKKYQEMAAKGKKKK